MWRFQVHDTVTGRLQDVVYPSAGSWTRRLSGMGDGSHSFVLRDSDLSRDQWRSLLEPWRSTLVVLWDFAPVYAGIITRTTYDVASGVVTANHEGIRTLFDARLTFANGNYASAGLAVVDKSPWGALRRILTRATGNTGRGLPLDLSRVPDGDGPITLRWSGPQLPTISDCIKALEDRGYDIDFVPQFIDDHTFSWAATIGKPLEGPRVEHTVTAEDSPLSSATVTIDAQKAATSVLVTGNGSGEDMLVAWAPEGLHVGLSPALERVDQAKRDREGLQGIADARLAARDWATVQWSFTVDLSTETPVSYVPTNIVRLHTIGDPWLQDIHRDLRVVSLAGDMTLSLKPEVV